LEGHAWHNCTSDFHEESFKIELLALLDLPQNLCELITVMISMVIYKFRKLECPLSSTGKKGGVAERNKIASKKG